MLAYLLPNDVLQAFTQDPSSAHQSAVLCPILGSKCVPDAAAVCHLLGPYSLRMALQSCVTDCQHFHLWSEIITLLVIKWNVQCIPLLCFFKAPASLFLPVCPVYLAAQMFRNQKLDVANPFLLKLNFPITFCSGSVKKSRQTAAVFSILLMTREPLTQTTFGWTNIQVTSTVRNYASCNE